MSSIAALATSAALLVTCMCFALVIKLSRAARRDFRKATANFEAATRDFERARNLKLEVLRLRAMRRSP